MVKKLLAVSVILTALLTFSSSLFAYEKNINCGGLAYTASNGDIYIADQQYTPNNMAGYVSGSIGSTTHTISGTPDQTLYQTELWNVSEHKFDLPNGFYNVTLKFVEMYFTSAGQRVFSVWIEGKKLISDLDIFRQVGHDTALDYTFTVEVKDGQLNIQQYASQGTTTISAIKVKSLITPQPQQLSLKGFNLTLDSTWNIAVNFSDTDDYFAAQELQNYIYTKYNLNIPLLNSPLISGTKYIVLANPTKDTSIQTLLTQRNLYPETSLNEEGYLLEGYSDNMIIISSNTPKGIFYGTQTLKQLISSSNNITTANAVKIKDWPDNKMRGMDFCGVDFSPTSPDYVYDKIDKMAIYKMNMASFETYYYDLQSNSDQRNKLIELFTYCRQRHIEPVPEMDTWSNGTAVTGIDLNTAEGVWIKDEQFRFVSNTAQAVNPVNLTVENPGFETDSNGDGMPDGWVIVDPNTGWPTVPISQDRYWKWDSFEKHSGNYSMKLSSGGNGNVISTALETQLIAVTPNTLYTLSYFAKKTADSSGSYNLAVRIAQYNQAGAYIVENFQGVTSVNNWGQERLNFYTDENCTTIRIWVWLWKGQGTLWVDDFKLERMNGCLANVLKTNKTDIVVTNMDKTRTYIEGVDYVLIRGNLKDTYYLLEGSIIPTQIVRKEGGSIMPGETVLVSYDLFVQFSELPWKKPYCPSDPKTYEIVSNAFTDVHNYLNPKYMSIKMDEVFGGMNRDSRCLSRNLTNSGLLADGINALYNCIRNIDPQVKIMMWDDMLNPWHFGGDVSLQKVYGGGKFGTTYEAADLIPNDIIQKVWWYSPTDDKNKMANSPAYFKSKGFDYLVSPWIDEKNIRMWADILRERKDSLGVMDTAWPDSPQGMKWNGLIPSADYSWCYKGIPYAVSSSNESYDTQAANAIDSNLTTRWASSWSDPQWIYIDFTTPKTFDAVKLTWETAYAKQYQIQISNNAVNWTTIYTENNSDGGLDIIPTGPQTARYVRMYGTQRGTQWGYSLYEFEVGNFSPQAYYPMDENTGTLIDDTSANHNNGSIYGATWTQGKINSSLNFDGNDYVTIGNPPSLNLTDEITISIWFKFNATPNWWNRLLEKGLWTSDASRGSYRIATGKDANTVTFEIYLEGRIFKSLYSPVLQLNRWYYLTGTYKSGNMALYLDGKLISTDTSATGRLQTTQDPLIIGANSGYWENFNGSIDELKIYNRALSSQEVFEEYKRTIPYRAYSSTIEGAGMEADKAIDNNTQTRWASQWSDPQWIYIDFTTQKTFSTITLNWEAAYGKAYQIQISNDALTWTTIYSTTTSAGGIQAINVGAQTARYVRMYGTQRGTQWGYSLWEFKVE